MGRSMLIVVVLMSTIFAQIIITLNRRMAETPDVMVRNLLTKEVEGVCDYSLRNAIRNAGSMQLLQVSGQVSYMWRYNNFRIGNCIVDSTSYTFVGSANHYKIKTYVRGMMQGQTVSHTAEMAFNYPVSTLGGKPNVFYYEFEEFLLFPWLFEENRYIVDSSDNAYTAENSGYLVSCTVPWGGAFSQYTAQFNGYEAYFQVGQDGSAPMINAAGDFSIVCFAKIDKDGRLFNSSNQGTIIWIPSDPYDTNTPSGTHPGQNLRQKPAAAIYYSTSDSKIHFVTTLNNSAKTVLDIGVAYTRTAQTHIQLLSNILNPSHTDYPWVSLGMTFSGGVFKAYINGVLRQTVNSGQTCGAMPSPYGMTMGRRDLRGSGVSYSDYKYYTGLIDQIGMSDRAISDAEMLTWHQGAQFQNSMLYIHD